MRRKGTTPRTDSGYGWQCAMCPAIFKTRALAVRHEKRHTTVKGMGMKSGMSGGFASQMRPGKLARVFQTQPLVGRRLMRERGRY